MSNIHWHRSEGKHTRMHMEARMVKRRSVQTIKVYFPQVWRGESQGRASVWALARGCQERLWCKPRTSQIPKFPTGHAAEFKDHKCCASSNRFRILCMSKQKQQCLWVCLHCTSVLASLILKWISLPPFSCICYDNNTF